MQPGLQYITELYRLAESCNGDIKDEMIYHRLVVGIQDAIFFQQLQLDPKPSKRQEEIFSEAVDE